MSIAHSKCCLHQFVPALLVVGFAIGFRCSGQDLYSPSTLELPKYRVNAPLELLPAESWRYTEAAGFEVLSNGPREEAERLVREFGRFNQALHIAWPALRPNTAGPVSLILCGDHNAFRDFVPVATRARQENDTASVFLGDGESSAIVIDLQAKVIGVDSPVAVDPTAAMAAGGLLEGVRINHDQQLYREYVLFLLSHMEPRCPAWFEEGLAQIVMGMRFDRDSVTLAKLENPNEISVEANMVKEHGASIPVPAEDRGFQATFRGAQLMGLKEMFAVSRDSEIARKPFGSLWAKQCYAFVHLCLYGQHPQRQREFLTFVERTTKEPVTETMFKECFKMSYQDMLLELRGYINEADYKSIEWKISNGLPELPAISFREATQAEIGYVKGEAMRLAGHADQAERTFFAPYMRGERDPRLLTAFGIYEFAAGRSVRAEELLLAATANELAPPRAYLALARIRFRAATNKPASGGKLTAEQVGAVLTPLFRDRCLSSPSLGVYVLIGETWIRSAEKPSVDNLGVLLEGVRLFPRATELLYSTAKLYAAAGVTEVADALIQQGLRVSRDDDRLRFEKLRESWGTEKSLSFK